MEDEIVDSGIIGYSELEGSEEFKEELENAKKEIEDLEDTINDIEREYEDLQEKYNALSEETDPYNIKADVIESIKTRLCIDNMMTPQLEEWLENYCRFYLDEV